MPEKSMSLNEARSALHKLLDWSEAIDRLRGVLDVAATLEEDISIYERKRLALADELAKAQDAHGHFLQDLADQHNVESQSLAAHATQVALDKAEISKQVAVARESATKLTQVFKEKADEAMDRIRAEQTVLQQELDELRKTHKALDEDVTALRAERQRVLSRFSAS